MSDNGWTKQENQILERVYPSHGVRETQSALGAWGFEHTIGAIYTQVSLLGISRDHRWTEHEEQVLRDNWQEMKDEELVSLLPGRTVKAITHRRQLLGLKHYRHVNYAAGQRFGRLTIIEEADERSSCGAVQYLCRCDCGNTKLAPGTDLRAGTIQSCGCMRDEWMEQKRMEPARVSMRQLYQRYEQGAMDRGYEWSLSIDEFKKLTKQPCHYCGVPPNNVNTKRDGQVYIYNGIDRVDNDKGYTLDNVVPCCKVCNWMKRDLSAEEFIAHCARVIEKSRP